MRSLRKILILFALITISFMWSCTNHDIKKPDSPGITAPAGRDRPLLKWEFTTRTRDGETFTRAILIIAGKTTQRYKIGTFYGGVTRIMIRGDDGGFYLQKEILSGFIVFNAGSGHEVYAGYDRNKDVLYVKSRRILKSGGTEPFSIVKTIPMKGNGPPVPVK